MDVQARNAEGEVYFEVRISDAGVWDLYRPARFVKNIRQQSLRRPIAPLTGQHSRM